MDPSIVFIDAAVAVLLFMMMLIIKYLWSHERRMTKIESDLYVSTKNPAAVPLTKKVEDTHNEVLNIKKTINIMDKNINKIFSVINKKLGKG